jgi:U3 small nucleolar RNA-associated protein 3
MRRLIVAERDLEQDGVEVLGLTDSDDDEIDDYDNDDQDHDDDNYQNNGTSNQQVEDEDKSGDSEDDLSGWGTSRKDFYGADAIDTEQAALEEEAEARRIQAKQLQSMTEADYGFDENWNEPEETVDEKTAGLVLEKLPEFQIPDGTTPKDRLKLLKERYPEFDALAREFHDLRSEYDRNAAMAQSGSISKTAELRAKTLSAYLGTIAMYFAILTSTAGPNGSLAKHPTEIHNHDIMESLIKIREGWLKIKDAPDSESDEDEPAISAAEAIVVTESQVKVKENGVARTKNMPEVQVDATKQRKSKRRAALEEDLEKLTTAALSTSRVASTKVNGTASEPNGDDSDFGDETEMTARERAEKARRRKTLRFYTSQITQTAQRRGAAGRDAGGDADLPHRERWRDRQKRLAEEAEKRAKARGEAGADQAEHDGNGSEDEYQQLVSRGKEAKAKAKRAARAAYEAQNHTFEEAEEVDGDGKRKINYQIEKNKGLAPFRKREIPRVRKRRQFEEKKKKLGSWRAVYKGGPGPRGYQGETTGIKTNLVRSTKL